VGPFSIETAWTLEAMKIADPRDYLIELSRAREMVESPAAIPTRPGDCLSG
jgi:hypothetical protein